MDGEGGQGISKQEFDYAASGCELDTPPGRVFYFHHNCQRYWKYIRPVRKSAKWNFYLMYPANQKNLMATPHNGAKDPPKPAAPIVRCCLKISH